MKLAILVGLALSITGCVATEPTSEAVQPLVNSCPPWMCGMNSPIIDNFGLHELNLDGDVSPDGFALGSFVQNGNAYVPSVADGRLTATNPSFGTLSGSALVGAQIQVTHGGTTAYVIEIVRVGTVSTWAFNPAGMQPSLETYQLQWAPARQGTVDVPESWTPLCPVVPDKNDSLTMNTFDSLLFEGERVDAAMKTISTTIEPRWFNIGCAGSLLAKLYLTGHTQAAAAVGFSTEIWQRQAMLQMFSADYCGDGTPFTVAGQRLLWEDASGYNKIPGGSNATLETRWNGSGVPCLMKPRVEVNPTPLSLKTFAPAPGLPTVGPSHPVRLPQPSDVEAWITSTCHTRPAQCADDSLAFDGYYVVSANPPPP